MGLVRNTGYAHYWKYIKHEKWVCDYCTGTTKNPTIGVAKGLTCPRQKPDTEVRKRNPKY